MRDIIGEVFGKENGPEKHIVKILKQFPVLYEGWEMDNVGWIAEFNDDSKEIIMSDHGGLYIASEEELNEKIEHYKKAIIETTEALDIIREG
jgi:hypothetical protein